MTKVKYPNFGPLEIEHLTSGGGLFPFGLAIHVATDIVRVTLGGRGCRFCNKAKAKSQGK